MKNTSSIVLSVLLLIFLFVGLTSSKNKDYPEAYTSALNTVYPALPKAIFTDYYTTESGVVRDIKLYSSRGYIVKKCEGVEHQMSSDWILIMEKY